MFGFRKKKAKEKYYILNFIDGERGDDSEAFIKAAVEHEQILYWAYVLHDKEFYNQHDMGSRYYGAQYCWADGFQGQEKYSSMQAYLDEQMSLPPYVGDKKEDRWYIFLIADGSVRDEDISDWFGMPNKYYLRNVTDAASVKDALESLTNEDHLSVSFERHRYSDDEVKSNFDFRKYMAEIKCYN